MSVDGLEPLVGVFALRTFRVSADGFLLPLSFNSDDWAKGFCIAGCVRAPHAAPDPRCTCGLYSLTDLHELRTQYHQADKLLAVVALEGISVEGAMGWRSQAGRRDARELPGHRLPHRPRRDARSLSGVDPSASSAADSAGRSCPALGLGDPPRPDEYPIRGLVDGDSGCLVHRHAALGPAEGVDGRHRHRTQPDAVGVRCRRGMGGPGAMPGTVAAPRRPGAAGLVVLPAGPVHLVGFQRRPVRLRPGHHRPARTAASMVPGLVRRRDAPNQTRRSVRAGAAPCGPFPARAARPDGRPEETALHRCHSRTTTFRHRTAGTHPICWHRGSDQHHPATHATDET